MIKKSSIKAYDLTGRIKSYDADMDIMHPKRCKMIELALDFLPFESISSLKAIDLGTGTGLFTEKFIKKFPDSKILAIDGAKTMIDLAKTRLRDLMKNVEFEISDFRKLELIDPCLNYFDVAFSSYAIHHLTIDEKRNFLKEIWTILKPGGWFLNADLIIAESNVIEKRIQQIRTNGIVKRSRGTDSRFKNIEITREFLNELELNEGDNPLTISEDLRLIKEAGFSNFGTLWQEYREVVYCGQK